MRNSSSRVVCLRALWCPACELFEHYLQIANKVGALLMTDMAHFWGLVAAQVLVQTCTPAYPGCLLAVLLTPVWCRMASSVDAALLCACRCCIRCVACVLVHHNSRCFVRDQVVADPFKYSHIVTTTTHKSLRGPRFVP